MNLSLILMFLTSSTLLLEAVAYKGLFLVTFATKSHMNFFGAVTKTLAENGHKITFVGPFKNNFHHDNITEVTTTEDYYNKIMSNMFTWTWWNEIETSLYSFPEMCTSSLTDPNVIEALKEKYDYIIMSILYVECFLDYVHKSKVPLIYISPNVIMNPYSQRIGALEFISVHPNKGLSYSYPMTFWERVESSLGDFYVCCLVGATDYRMEMRSRELGLWSPDTPSVSELKNQASLAIINSIRPLETPVKVVPPNIVYAGGIHIKSNNSLPKQLDDWLNGSGEDGFILFSLGTTIKSDNLKKEHLDIILNVFRKLKQRVIWKFETKNDENFPSNVMISSFLPQQDILAHPKIRLFITHGGLFSLLEATYYGVPIVGLPIFGDQTSNIKETVTEGWGRLVQWEDLTEETFLSAIQQGLTNDSMRETVKRRAMLMRDWPMTPSKGVLFWIDYVIRHKGAKHLQSPFVNLPLYEIYNVDVWAFIVTCLTIGLCFLFYIMKFVFRFCRGKLYKLKKE